MMSSVYVLYIAGALDFVNFKLHLISHLEFVNVAIIWFHNFSPYLEDKFALLFLRI